MSASTKRLAKPLEYSLEPKSSNVGPSSPLTNLASKGGDKLGTKRPAKALEYSLKPKSSNVGPSSPLTNLASKGGDKLFWGEDYSNYYIGQRVLTLQGLNMCTKGS